MPRGAAGVQFLGGEQYAVDFFTFGIGLFGFVLFPGKGHVTAEGDQGEAIVGFAAPELEEFGAEPQREGAHADTEQAGDGEMAEFMKKDEAAKDKQHGEGAFPVREYVEQKVHLHLLYPQADAEPGFVVKGFDGFERSRIGGRTLVQRPADDVGNVHEADAAGQKRLDRDLVGRVERNGQGGTFADSPAGEFKARKGM